ncbi:MAG: DUF2127 domain-containing protein [Proteobacteria bacterium]|nr:DUF2127 domain-containing protein [Pseudomonadota bacterium]MBU1596677.1 DUF2127 domain-containing protein [Pseudomonadota bacterium]
MPDPVKSADRPAGLKLVALLELSKGALVLLAGLGLLALLHRDVGDAAEDLVRLFHLNPASRTPRVFIEAADKLTDARLWWLAAAALGYALVRVAEACGLWLRKAWAEWFGALTGAIYIPIEIYELTQKLTWPRILILTVNALVVGYLALELLRRGALHAPRLGPLRPERFF